MDKYYEDWKTDRDNRLRIDQEIADGTYNDNVIIRATRVVSKLLYNDPNGSGGTKGQGTLISYRLDVDNVGYGFVYLRAVKRLFFLFAIK